MAFGVMLTLDPVTDMVVRGVWSALADAGVDRSMLDGGVPPHVTLTLGEHVNLAELQSAMAGFAATTQSFRITLSSLGTFPTAEGVLFFGVTVTQTLLEVHAEFSRIFSRFARQPNAYYRMGTWVPHCTLAMGLGPDGLLAATEIARRTQLPVFGNAVRLGLVEVGAIQPRELASFHLGRR